MKNNNLDLNQLLAELEHAGRNARRQEQLTAIIDRLAEAESTKQKHNLWWWSSRIAAAACILFFVSTAIRIWFIPTAYTPYTSHLQKTFAMFDPKSIMPTDTTAYDIEAIEKPSNMQIFKKTANPAATTSPLEPSSVLMAETKTQIDNPLVDSLPTIEEPLPDLEELIRPEETIAESTIEEQPTLDKPNEPTETIQQQPRRSGLLSTLLSRHRPSKMDGTILAFNIL